MDDRTDFAYYRTVAETQHDPEILRAELSDLIKEAEAEVGGLRAENERLRKSVRDHEEDCACLPEDYSVTETVKALRGRVEGLEKALVAMIGLYDNDDWYNDKVASEAKAALEGGSRE